VEVSGDGEEDLGLTLTWKRRSVDSATGAVAYVPAKVIRTSAAPKA
jgi:hypothetical protein